MELLEETVKLPQLCVSPEDFMNPDTTVGGFPAFLGLVQQVQCTLVISAMIEESGLRKTGSKMSGQARRLLSSMTSANDANEANSSK